MSLNTAKLAEINVSFKSFRVYNAAKKESDPALFHPLAARAHLLGDVQEASVCCHHFHVHLLPSEELRWHENW